LLQSQVDPKTKCPQLNTKEFTCWPLKGSKHAHLNSSPMDTSKIPEKLELVAS